MKKLSLNKMKLEAGDMLQREQLKTVFGGYSIGEGTIGTCAYQHPTLGVVVEASRETAERRAKRFGTHWCCESCCTTSWANGYGC